MGVYLNKYKYNSQGTKTMTMVTYSEARNCLKAVLDGVHDDADVTVISRRDGADAVACHLTITSASWKPCTCYRPAANAAPLAKYLGAGRDFGSTQQLHRNTAPRQLAHNALDGSRRTDNAHRRLCTK
ncbi:MAG: hypothetical protein OHK0048_24670 [Rhodoferax sp.]